MARCLVQRAAPRGRASASTSCSTPDGRPPVHRAPSLPESATAAVSGRQAKPQRRRQIATTPAVGPPGARTGGPASPDFLPRSETELTVVSLQHASRSCYCIEICQCPDHRVELPSRHSSPVGDGGHVRGAAAVLSRLVLSAAKPNTISVREPNSGLIRLGG